MPLNQSPVGKIDAYKPSKEDAQVLADLRLRTDTLRQLRTKLLANPYDISKTARTIEETWDLADYLALPHKFSHREMKDWQAKNSRPMIFAKIDTALATLIAKNPQVEIAAKQDRFAEKSKILTALYDLSWDKGNGRQQFIKFVYNCAKYGFAVAREYHRYEEVEIDEVQVYDPENLKHETAKKKVIKHDEPYFEVLPIRDCWFDDRARPYDEDSLRDWFWEQTYDYSTLLKKFPENRYPNIKYVIPSYSSTPRQYKKDKADVTDDQNPRPQVRLLFYENREDNEFIITDNTCTTLIYKGPLLDNELSCVIANWRIRNEWTIYGVGLPEILENDQELLDRVSNMTINQIMLAIGGSGFYGGTGTFTEKDATLEPKIKKLRDVDKLVFPKIPMPDPMVFTAIEDIRQEADDVSGVTATLQGDELGKTLGEAILNREAGLRRLTIPLTNLEFALERHARLRINNIQRIYSKPNTSTLIRNALGEILDEKLWMKYQQSITQLDQNELMQKFPNDPLTGVVFANEFKTERLPFEKGEGGVIQPSEKDNWLEISPEEIRGEYDVRIRAMSTLPVSQALEESRALETFNMVAQLPYTDIYKAQKRLLNKRNEDPEDWMQSEQEIIQKQQAAQMGMQTSPPTNPGDVQGGTAISSEQGGTVGPMVPPSETPADLTGITPNLKV